MDKGSAWQYPTRGERRSWSVVNRQSGMELGWRGSQGPDQMEKAQFMVKNMKSVPRFLELSL